MPHFCFTFEPSSAGCVERVCLFTPWAQPARAPNGSVVQPADQAWAYLQSFASQRDQNNNPSLVFSPGCKINCMCTNPGGTGNTPNVYCIQKADPYVGRAQVNAPYGQPVSSGGMMSTPPLPSKDRLVPQGVYEELNDCALPRTNDSLLGEMDGEGGTYTDVDSQGREIPRQMMMPPSQKVAGR